MSSNFLPNAVVGADPEVVVDPVGHVRIVTAPAEQEQRVLALARVRQVGGVVLLVDLESIPRFLNWAWMSWAMPGGFGTYCRTFGRK